MVYTDSVSTRGTLRDQVLAIAHPNVPTADIQVHQQNEQTVLIYTSGDRVEGEVLVKSAQDCRFDSVHITLDGFSKTYVENMAATTATTSRSDAFHPFLKLEMPTNEALYPQPRIFAAGQTYRFPFTFVIPHQLLPGSCSHTCDSDAIHQAHLRLPPTLADRNSVEEGQKMLYDFGPMMTRVSYGIKVAIRRHRQSDDKDVLLVEKIRKIRVMPASQEEPPLSVDDQDREYRLRKEKVMKKGLFKGKMGSIVVDAAQPKSLCLPPPRSVAGQTSSTMLCLVVRFDPTNDSVDPPRLGVLTSKLKVNTYYASRPMNDVPRRSGPLIGRLRGLFAEHVTLSSRCVQSAQWTRFDPTDLRRDSAWSSASTATGSEGPIPLASDTYKGGIFYTSKVLVPVSLPKDKTFVPTFHSCLLSRVYVIELGLQVHTPSSTRRQYTLKLRVPVQVTQARNFATSAANVIAEEEAAVDSFFDPRTTTPTDTMLAQASQPLPSARAPTV
ncbi:MAG: hypothetical protein M1838_003239, partial [Thelocarpon superellum]